MMEESLKFWKIEELSEAVEVLEDAFGEIIEKYKSGLTYNDILIRAYAYAIIVMKEIICLLSNGFPDGALARARRLYEQMVLIDYFESRKIDLDFDKLVERYCDSQNIVAYSNQIALYDFFENKEEQQKAQMKYDKLKGKYAQFFKQKKYVRDYWWIDDEKCNTFNKLQKRYCDPYGRILYSRVCISTHAGAMGDYELLGRFNPNGDRIYTGATNKGFSLPLILATMSFYNITNMVFENLEIDFPKEYKKIEALLNYYQNTLFVALEV